MLIERLREMPPARKLELLASLNRAVRTLAMTGLREQFPGASDNELRRRLADRLIGPELAEQAFGPLPEHEAGA
jgi:hypothetical protein